LVAEGPENKGLPYVQTVSLHYPFNAGHPVVKGLNSDQNHSICSIVDHMAVAISCYYLLLAASTAKGRLS